MMLYYWVKRGIRPSFFHELPEGEFTIIKAFYEIELDEKSKSEISI